MARTKDLPDGWEQQARQIGIRLQQARHALDLSQEDVAHRAHLSAYTYQKFEKGESKPGTPLNPRLTTLLALCDVLDLRLSDLVEQPPQQS